MSRIDSKKLLIIIFLLALLIRILPFLMLNIPLSLDSYLHINIAAKVLEKKSLLSYDILSILGFKAYSYPPGFHVLLAIFMSFLPQNFAAHFISALIGALTVIMIFFISEEIFKNKKISLFSAFFFATAPSHVFRTAIPIPEALGVFLFTISLFWIIKYLKTKEFKYVLFTSIILLLYLVSHRGWPLFILSALLLFFVYHLDILKRKQNLIILGIFIVLIYFIITNFFLELLLRVPIEAVSALGYFKWVGIIQFTLGIIGIILLIRTKDRFKLFLILWAFLLLGIGAFSFRVRDPYAVIPISLLASYALITYILPKISRIKNYSKIIISILIIISISQGFYTSLFLEKYPTKDEINALVWLKNNSPKDSVVLTWKEEGNYIIGIAERKDIVMWKKVYQGFLEEPPSVEEAKRAYGDVATAFRSTSTQQVFDIINKYSVDYIYIDKRMRTELGALEYGLVEYISYDTHFKPLFINNNAEIYRLEKGIYPEKYEKRLTEYINFENYTLNLSLLPYIENYWNGFAYFDQNYRINYATNAKIALTYLQLYHITENEAFKYRSEWLIDWLNFKQLEDGSWADQNFNMPRKSTATTCIVTNAMIETYDYNLSIMDTINKSANFLYSQIKNKWIKTFVDSETNDYTTNAICLPTLWKLNIILRDKKFAEVAKNIASNLVKVQSEDGSWTYGEYSTLATVNSQVIVLGGLSKYYNLTKDKSVQESINKGITWLISKQDKEGKFSDYVTEKGKVIKTTTNSYTKSVHIYEISKKEINRTLNYLLTILEPESENLETLIDIISILNR